MKLTNLIKEMEEYAIKENVPIMKKDGINYILDFIDTNNIENVLEIGTAICYSTILISTHAKSITSIERNEDRYNIAINNMKLSNQQNITLIKGDALNITIDEKFDLIFIDAAKGKNKEFITKYKNNLNKNGYIIIDNMDFHGLVGKSSTITKRRLRSLVRKIEDFIKYMEEQTEFKVTKINKGDGLYLLERINNE